MKQIKRREKNEKENFSISSLCSDGSSIGSGLRQFSSFHGDIDSSFQGSFDSGLDSSFDGSLCSSFESGFDSSFDGSLDSSFHGSRRCFQGSGSGTDLHIGFRNRRFPYDSYVGFRG